MFFDKSLGIRSLLKEISEKYCSEKIGLSNDSDGDNNSDNNNNEKVLLNKDIVEVYKNNILRDRDTWMMKNKIKEVVDWLKCIV